MSPAAFWDETPRTFGVIMRGRIELEKRRFRVAAWHAWHAAALSRAETMPSLETLLGDKARPDNSRQSADEMLAIARQLAAMGLGSVELPPAVKDESDG